MKLLVITVGFGFVNDRLKNFFVAQKSYLRKKVLSEIICTLVHGFLDVVITKAMKKGAASCLPLSFFLGQQCFFIDNFFEIAY
jgi:hypothetical protein